MAMTTDVPHNIAAPLEVDDLVVDVLTDRGWTTVVDHVSFALRRGETLGLVGESGSGKSVTCMSVAGLLPPRTTRIRAAVLRLLQHDLLAISRAQFNELRGPRIAMVFQEPMTSLNPAFTVGDQIAESIRRHCSVSRREAKERAIGLLDRVGVPDPRRRYSQYPFEFSGGMRQRVVIAIALACNPDVIIADEPTTALDVTVQAQILGLLRDLQAEHGMSIILITHDLGVVADICDRVLVMYAGQLVESAPVEELFVAPRHPYTEGLLAAIPRLDDVGKPATIPGQPPQIGAFPDGCRFAPRCRHAVPECNVTAPPLSPVTDNGDAERTARCLRLPELTLRGTT
ncbi:oligopeptide/dipeptide ABC transporter, ATP-binding protein [Prauserella sp. Am3]|nr:oligopeptide/dipeptide ABC transporter, ATP-binding protein [Prauserella sp. Am3]